MKQRTVRIPENLSRKIDELVTVDHLYSTKADFILSSIRYTLILYAQKKKEIVEDYPDIPLTNGLIDQTYSAITNTYLTTYDLYTGDPVQINVRIPDGLDDRISHLTKVQYGFNKKADFIKVSIICLLTTVRETEDIFNDIEKMMKDQEALMEEIYANVMKGMSQKKSGPEIIRDTLNNVLKNNDIEL